MNYHLHRDGQTVGVFSLDELRRRRQAGELAGNDLVWREGMPAWKTLDSILQSAVPVTPPPFQAPIPTSTGRHALIWGLSIAGVIVLLGIAAVSVVAVRYARRFQQISNQNKNGS